jgi:phage terminase large subunit
MEPEFEVHETHLQIWDRQDWRYAFLMGGRGNGRSGTASRYVVSRLFAKEYARGALMRAVHADIRTSSWAEVIDRFEEQGIREAQGLHIADNDMLAQYGRNSLRAHGFKASAGSLTARLKSLANYNLVWVEEGEEIGEAEFMKLDDTLRTKKGSIKLVFTLNTPPKSHWIIKRWFDLTPHQEAKGFYIPSLKPEIKDAIYIPGTWRENEPNLDPATVLRYQSYKQTKPAYYWQVIEGLCPEQKRGKIFTGWQQIDSVPEEARLVRFGEDFGWFPDPACAVAIYYWNGSYIVDELAYGTELTNEYLAGEIKNVGDATTVADSAEPKSIAEQNGYGIHVIGSAKGRDSVNFRIKVASTKKIFVTARSKNVWDSYENYAWAEDKDGNPKGEPAHAWSHAMDAVTYPIADLHNAGLDEEDEEIEEETEPVYPDIGI